MAKATKTSVLRTLNEAAGRKDYFEAREVETESGTVTQIISGGGSLVAQVNATGDEAWEQLEGFTGAGVVDAGENPKESVEDNKKFYSKSGAVAFPTQPEAIEAPKDVNEIDNSDKSVAQENQTASRTVNQASTVTEDQRSSGTPGTSDNDPNNSGNEEDK